MRTSVPTALAAVLLSAVPTAGWAQQDDLAARRAVAHALVDQPVAANVASQTGQMRSRLDIPEAEANERAAFHQAFEAHLPTVTREAQDAAANFMADHLSLAQLKDPSSIPPAEQARLQGAVRMEMVHIGERFAATVLRTGCQVDDTPSTFCRDYLSRHAADVAH